MYFVSQTSAVKLGPLTLLIYVAMSSESLTFLHSTSSFNRICIKSLINLSFQDIFPLGKDKICPSYILVLGPEDKNN